MSINWLQLAQEALKIPGLLVEIYGDLAKPGVRQVGKALDTVLGLGNTVLWPVQWVNERTRMTLQQNLQKYRQKLENMADEEIVSVAPEIGVPIAEKLAYVADGRLSDLYVELLATASKVNTVSHAHPSFVNVIDNLSPDEAVLLEEFVGESDMAFVSAKWVHPNTGVYSFASELLIDQLILSSLMFPGNLPAYISNLAGLGIVTIHPERSVYESSEYEYLEQYWRPLLPDTCEGHPERTLQFQNGVVCLTTFGRQFMDACGVKATRTE